METLFKTVDLNWPFFYAKTRFWLIMTAFLLSVLPLPGTITVIISITLIGTIGLMHGATDHLLFISYRKLQHLKTIPKHFYIVYLSVLFAMGGIWLILPELAIAAFIIASCYHFGQTQLQYIPVKEKDWRKKVIYLFWGLLVLSFIVLLNPEETTQLLSPFNIETSLTLAFDKRYMIMTVGAVVFVGLFLWLNSNTDLPKKALFFELIELTAICLVAIRGDLLFSFAIFFSLWHSLRAAQVQIKKLRAEQIVTAKRFVGESLPFTLLSIFGIAMLFAGISYFEFNIHPFMVVLIAISILTMPHMIIYERFYNFHDQHK